MAGARLWTRVPFDDSRCLIYGAGWGRFYLVDRSVPLAPVFQRVLGLRSSKLVDSIRDPVERIELDRSRLRDHERRVPPLSARLAYRFFHSSRGLIPLRWMTSLIHEVARRAPASRTTISELGRRVFEVEHFIGLEDCYPRAILTLYWCIRARHPCQVLVGCLVPTRKMHVWCSSAGILPYEASPEHYMYQPAFHLSYEP